MDESVTTSPKRWLTTGELAAALGFSETKVRELTAEMQLPHIRYSRTCIKYHLEDVEDVLREKLGVFYPHKSDT